MAVQLAVSTRNAKLTALADDLGASPILELRSGAQPANAAAGDSGTLVASMTLPADPFADPAAGSMSFTGTWQDLSANADATVAHFRMKTSGGVCKAQGSCSLSGGGGDMILSAVAVLTGQQVTVISFTLTEGNA